MERTVSRRIFVGSVAAGIPLVAGSAAYSLASSSTGQPHLHRIGTTDSVFEHATTQLALLVNKVRRDGPAGEIARLAAAQFSALAVYGQSAGIDTQTSRAVRDLIRSKGRDAVLDIDVDRRRVVAQLKTYGVDVDERWITGLQPDRVMRTKVLDDLSRTGVSGMLASIAANLQHVAVEIERRRTHSTGIRLVQDDESWRTAYCAQLWLEVSVQAAHAAMLCAAMIFMPGMESQCAFAQMSVMFFLSIYYAMCF